MAQRSASTHSCLVLPSCAHLEASSPPLPGPQWVPWWNLPEQPHAPDQTRRLSRLLPAGAVLTAGRRAAPSTPHPSTPHPPTPAASPLRLCGAPWNLDPDPGGPAARARWVSAAKICTFSNQSNTSGPMDCRSRQEKAQPLLLKPDGKDICKTVTVAVRHKIFMLKYKRFMIVIFK